VANAYAQIQFFDQTGTLLNTATYSINDADGAKFFAAFIATFPPPNKADGSPGTPYTTAQIIGIIAQSAFNGWTALINNYTNAQAAAAAVANPSNPIAPILSYTTAP